MADNKCKADAPLHPDQAREQLNQQLLDLSNGLFKLVCISRFYHQAFHAITTVNNHDWPLDEQAQYGLFTIGEWLHEQGNTLIQQAETMIQSEDKNQQ